MCRAGIVQRVSHLTKHAQAGNRPLNEPELQQHGQMSAFDDVRKVRQPRPQHVQDSIHSKDLKKWGYRTETYPCLADGMEVEEGDINILIGLQHSANLPSRKACMSHSLTPALPCISQLELPASRPFFDEQGNLPC